MSFRLTQLLFAVGVVALAGCAHEQEIASADVAVSQDAHVTVDAGRVADGYPEPVAPPVHVTETTSFGEPPVVPVGLTGPKAVADTDGDYLLDTGDKLRVFVYGQPNLSRLYTLDHNGNITVPLIGTVHARGLTTSALEKSIRGKLGTQYVRDPQVTVDVQQNRPFYILGEVKTAGQYPYVSGMTVENAVAIGGGYSERADERRFRITRRINGMVEQIEAPSDYVLKPGDTVYVRERIF